MRIKAALFATKRGIVKGDEIFYPDELRSLVALLLGNESDG